MLFKKLGDLFVGNLKLNKKYIQSILIVALYAVLALFMYGVLKRDFVWNGDDVYYHFQRIMGLSNNLTDGLLTSNISSTNFGKIGYGVNIFYPWLTLLPFQIIFHFTRDWINTYYLGLLLFFFSSFLISHFSMKQLAKSNKVAVLFAIIYNFSTYRLIEVFTRAALAEYIASIFVPLCFLGLYQIFFGDSKHWKPLAVGLSLVIFSHVLTVFMCLMMFVLVLVLFIGKIKWSKTRVLNFFKAVLTTVLATVIFTVPFLMEEAFDKYGVPDPTVLKGQDISKLLLASFNSTSNRAIEGNIYNIGLIMVVALFLGILAFRRFNWTFKAIYIMFVVTFLLGTNIFPWYLLQNTPIQVIQYPFRFFMFTTLFGSAVAAQGLTFIFEHWSTKTFSVLTVLTAVVAGGLWYSSISNAYPHSLLSKPELIITQKMIADNKVPESYIDQYVPVRATKQLENIKHHEVNINDKIIAQIPTNDNHRNVYTLQGIKKGDVIDLPYIRYKYTQAKVNGRRVPITFSKRGTVQMIAKHNYSEMRISLSYGDKGLFTLATSFSVLAWIYLLFSEVIASALSKLRRPKIEIPLNETVS